MSETLICPITCPVCGREFELEDENCFINRVGCNCGENFENYELDSFLQNFIKNNFFSEIAYNLDNQTILLDTKNSAIFLGFYNKMSLPDSRKIADLCRSEIIIGLPKKVRERWKIPINSIYFYQKKLKKFSTGISVKEAAKRLNISEYKVKKRIKLPIINKDYIYAERKNENYDKSPFVVFLKTE
jgi:hypothetical protein